MLFHSIEIKCILVVKDDRLEVFGVGRVGRPCDKAPPPPYHRFITMRRTADFPYISIRVVH